MTKQRLGRGVKRIVVLSVAAISLLVGFSSVNVSAAPTAVTGLNTHSLKRQEQHKPPAPEQPPHDYCSVLGSLVEPFINWHDVQRCYQSVPFNAADADATLSTLYTYYRDYYIFIDSAMLENQAKPFTNPPVDILKGLDEISQKRYKSDFEFHTDVELLINRLNDAHANYMRKCFFLFTLSLRK